MRPASGHGSLLESAVLPESADAVVENVVSILKFFLFLPGANEKQNPGQHTVLSLDATVSCNFQALVDIRDVPESIEESGDSIGMLQLLLPSRQQVWQLVDYHEDCLLWYHASYFGPTFRGQLEGFYEGFEGKMIENGKVKGDVNLQWVALLFSVLTGTLTCAPPLVAQSWGFQDPEKELLSKRWFHAVITCLNKANYTSNQSILSVQAISTLTISAHSLGYSNSHLIHLSSAVKIAKSLGLHRLKGESPGSTVEKETGRRLWQQLCLQYWFSIPFSESYLINPLYSQSEAPLNCHDDMVPLPDHVPTITSYSRFLASIASIMPQLQEDLLECNTAHTKYNQVLKWDKHLRTLATTERPLFLMNVPIGSDWPVYTSWARRASAISSSRKIIMIHRSFLSESFVKPAFSFTRRTCLAASKTIIKEYKCIMDENGPILWVHQAFSIAAGIILVLDVLHRDYEEPEYSEHKGLVEDVVSILREFHSVVTLRGSKLLSALLDEIALAQTKQSVYETSSKSNSKRRRLSREDQSIRKTRGNFNVPEFVKRFCNGQKSSTQNKGQNFTDTGSYYQTPTDAFPSAHMMDTLGSFDLQSPCYPPGLEGATSFENLLHLANHDFWPSE